MNPILRGAGVDTTSQQLRTAAEAHAANGDWDRAVECFESVLERRPGDADVLLQLSYIESLAGRYRRARERALQAHARRPSQPAVVKELIARLRTFNEMAAIEECIARLPPLDRVAIPLLIAFGAQLSYLNLQERALVFLDEAHRGDPEYPPTLLARAQVLTYLGRFDEAERDLERSLKRAPGIAKTYWQLANLGRSRDEGLARLIGAQLQRPGLGAEDTALLAYALHMELDRHRRYEPAWRALELACRAKRSTIAYQASQTEELVSALIAWSAHAGAPVADATPGAHVPIFIVGMHRSGTSLLEEMLDGHPEVQGIGELYDFTTAMRHATDHHCRGVIDAALVEKAGAADFEKVGRRYLEKLQWRLGRQRYFTDKLPSNFLNTGFICRALPQAKIIHMTRDPVETCFSNLRELFSDANPYSYDPLELADFHHQYRRLMAHWHERFPGRILDVDYRRLTREPEQVSREVAAFCGFEFVPSMLDVGQRGRSVATASAVQVRQGIRTRDVPKWKPYEAHLHTMIERLEAGRR